MSVETTLAALNIDPNILNEENKQETAFYQEIVHMVEDFERNLSENEKMGVSLVSNGQAFEFYLNAIRFGGANLIRLQGVTSTGSKVNLIQHMNQTNFMLISLPKLYIK